MSEIYAPEEPRSFDAIIERQPYEPAKEAADSINAHEAADLVSQTRGEQNEIIKRHVRDPEDVNRVAPADVTWTAETAADALKSARELEHNLEQESLDAQLAAKVDEFRGAPQEQQPEACRPNPIGRRRFSKRLRRRNLLSWIICWQTCLLNAERHSFRHMPRRLSRRKQRQQRNTINTSPGATGRTTISAGHR